jgi:hypothetical protein
MWQLENIELFRYEMEQMCKIDPILSSRLNKLERKLWDIQIPLYQSCRLTFKVSIEKRVGLTLDASIRKKIDDQLKAIEEIRKDLKASVDLKDLWAKYNETYKESQKIFDEYIEVLGGLALRDKLDNESSWMVWNLADHLIQDCSEKTCLNPSLAVPSAQEALTRTLARIIRMRFEEWTIWNLPFTSHEFGHVVIEETDYLPNFLNARTDFLTKCENSYFPGCDEEKIRAALRCQLEEFFADAFATYTMGPAYACAAIILRFDPIIKVESNEKPSDLKRVFVVLGMLEWMNNQPQSPTGSSPLTSVSSTPFRNIINKLRATWGDMLTKANPKCMLKNIDNTYFIDNADIEQLMQFVTLIGIEFNKEFGGSPARYSRMTGDNAGWDLAENQSKNWQSQLEKKFKISDPKGTLEELDLRDILNAVWDCRLFYADNDENKIALIENGIMPMFDAIAEKHCELSKPKGRKARKSYGSRQKVS